uniref:Glutathione synthase substrate-binding domain-containing protein n=1 Tax=Aegilops tauschii subsp. strangulata TaxID=200361 RepID=A0A453HW48_AEGTS
KSIAFFYRTKKVEDFTAWLLEIHAKMMAVNKKEDLNQYSEVLGLDSERIPRNWAASQFAEALGKAWVEYNNESAVVTMVVQAEERNMYDQYWLINHLKESHGVMIIRKTLAQVEAEGLVLPDGTLVVYVCCMT